MSKTTKIRRTRIVFAHHIYRPCACGETAHDYKLLGPDDDGFAEAPSNAVQNGSFIVAYACRNCYARIYAVR